MALPSITPSASIAALADRLPSTRGRVRFGAPLAPYCRFRAGGAADALFLPADEADLAQFLARCPPDIPVTPIGAGSNLIIRDGGVSGVVVRLGSAFGAIKAEGEARIVAGAGALDARVARVAARAGIGGLEFLSGVPGSIGGALAMNAGCYGTDIASCLASARALRRNGESVTLSCGDLDYAYRHSGRLAREWLVFVEARFRGRKDAPDAIAGKMAALMAGRAVIQPVREKTGGSTFANPCGKQGAAWRLIDEAGCRGLAVGDARISERHCNFIINRARASATDLERLGEEVRRRVLAKSGVALRWEVRRIGRKAQ